MAEPVIISYARGLLKEFPGVPEGTVDVIPVDIVVAAIIAVAAVGPDRAPSITQVASGGVNPLKYRRWSTTSAASSPAPALRPRGPADRGARVELPRPRPRAGPAEPGQDGHHPRREGAAGAPAARQAGRAVRQLEEKRIEVERALEYVELYGLYTECEAIYQVDNLLSMWDSLTPADQEAFFFDPRVVDWPTYVNTIHLPSVVEHARVKTTPGKSRTPDRMTRLRAQVLDPKRHVAAFDLENTLIASNVVESYSFLATRRLNGPSAPGTCCARWPRRPGLLKLDRSDRTDFLRHFYRRYEDAPVAQIEDDAKEMLTQLILTKSFPEGLRRVREHKAAGHRTVLITGALSSSSAGLRPLFDEIIAAEMSVRPDGTYSGEMSHGAAHR